MQRALGASEPTVRPVVKPQPSPSKVFTPPAPEQKDVQVRKEKSIEPTAVKKEVTQAPLEKKETPKAEAPLPTGVQKTEIPRRGSVQKTQVPPGTEQGKDHGVTGQQQPVGKSPQVQVSQTTKPEVKAGPVKQEAGKPPQQPPKSPTPAAKSAPPPAQPTKQESGGFFGFGGPKTQPAAAKPAESVTGKMFGFGSSIFSSASTLITSAVQDQPKTTPPVSPKMSPAKEIKSPAAQKVEQQKKTEPSQQTKTHPVVQTKLDKAPSEPPKAATSSQATVKPHPSACPLCKVELNMGSKDSPNYNTCTECKNTVCNQCGFNPMPNETAVRLKKINKYLIKFEFYILQLACFKEFHHIHIFKRVS